MKKTLIMLWMAVSLMVVSFAGCTSEEMDYENPNVSLFVKQKFLTLQKRTFPNY